GTSLPDPRAERECGPVRDRTHRTRRGAVPRALPGGRVMTRPFTVDDFAQRMEHAVEQASDAGLTGVLVTPGPDLVSFTGYQPIGISERITMLVLDAERDPALIVPVLERPDAEAAPGAAALALSDWTDGSDPYAAAAKLLDPRGHYAISDSAWAMHV